jgi:hypothetical protein
MFRRVLVSGLILILAGCEKSDTKILIGATTITSAEAAPIPGSVIVVAGKTIRAVGLQKNIPIPQDSDRSDLSGKWVVPQPGGRISAGEPANLLVLDHAPSGVPQPADASRRMIDGQWQSVR